MSVAYTTAPTSPPGRPSTVVSPRANERSNFAVDDGTGTVVTTRSANSNTAFALFCSASITWKSGFRARERAGLTFSTTCSNGTSWLAWAIRLTSRTRATSSRKSGSPAVSVRSTSVFTKNPTSSSSASSVRPAIGVPNGMSVPAPSRVSRPASAACSTMNNVAPLAWASASSFRWTSAPTRKSTMAPSFDATAGRARSTGSTSSSGSPVSAPCQ